MAALLVSAGVANRARHDTSPASTKGNEIGQEEESSSSRVVKGRRPHAEDDGKIKSGRCQDRKGVEANDWRDRGQGASTRCVAGYKELVSFPTNNRARLRPAGTAGSI